METMGAAVGVLGHQNQPPQKTGGERLNAEIQSELNLESVRTRAISLYKAISRIIEEVDGLARSNSSPKA
ncbi:Mediator of RNA polymerase II transcription subunit 8-like protein [Drosera capensis]